jgi:hypothetical protein
MHSLARWLIGWPERVAQHLQWVAPLFARLVVGWVFMWSGWGKLQNLPAIIDNFAGWKIPAPHLLAPFVSGVEFFGGIFLLLGLMTRISAGGRKSPASVTEACGVALNEQIVSSVHVVNLLHRAATNEDRDRT